jgi:bifunctional non-homologous end joining protein LigD
MFLDGADLRPLPLLERKRRLDHLLRARAPAALLQYSAHTTGDAAAIFAAAARMRLEGIVSKRVDAPYRSGRTGDWVKAKCLGTDEFVVVGYVVSKADPAAVGALVLGYFGSSGCVHAGRVGTGFTHDEARTLQAALRPLEGPRPDMAGRLSRADLAGVRWTAPRLVVAVNYAGWSADNLLRHAVYAGLRQDKAARNVGPPATRA